MQNTLNNKELISQFHGTKKYWTYSNMSKIPHKHIKYTKSP